VRLFLAAAALGAGQAAAAGRVAVIHQQGEVRYEDPETGPGPLPLAVPLPEPARLDLAPEASVTILRADGWVRRVVGPGEHAVADLMVEIAPAPARTPPGLLDPPSGAVLAASRGGARLPVEGRPVDGVPGVRWQASAALPERVALVDAGGGLVWEGTGSGWAAVDTRLRPGVYTVQAGPGEWTVEVVGGAAARGWRASRRVARRMLPDASPVERAALEALLLCGAGAPGPAAATLGAFPPGDPAADAALDRVLAGCGPAR